MEKEHNKQQSLPHKATPPYTAYWVPRVGVIADRLQVGPGFRILCVFSFDFEDSPRGQKQWLKKIHQEERIRKNPRKPNTSTITTSIADTTRKNDLPPTKIGWILPVGRIIDLRPTVTSKTKIRRLTMGKRRKSVKYEPQIGKLPTTTSSIMNVAV